MTTCIMVYRRHHKDLSWHKCEVNWNKCEDKQERRVIITEALNECRTMVNKENFEEILKKFRVHVIQEYYEYTEGLTIPPRKPHFLYAQKRLKYVSLKKITKATDQAISYKYLNLPYKTQLKFFKKYFEMWMDFDFKLKKWRESERTKFDVYLDKKAYAFKVELRTKPKKLPIRKRVKNWVEVCMPMTVKQFPDQPKNNPVTVPTFLEQLIPGKSLDFLKKNYIEILEDVHPILRNSILEIVWHYRNEYKLSLLMYVKKMPEELRKLFLGYHRKPIFEKMMEDIFKNDYPSSKYPVYKYKRDAFLKKKRAMLDTPEDNSTLNNANDTPLTLNNADETSSTFVSANTTPSTETFNAIKVIYDSLDQLKTWAEEP